MFLCVQQVLKTFTLNDKQLQGVAGFTAMLHTHSRRLDYHPHIHVVMPAASIHNKYGLWRVKSGKYIFNHKALAKVFRAKLLKSFVDHHLQVPKDCPRKWVVDCKNVGNGDKALIYLGRYLYKGVIQQKKYFNLQRRQRHLSVYGCQNQALLHQNRSRRIFPLVADAARAAQRLSQGQMLRVLASLQQKGHYIITACSTI